MLTEGINCKYNKFPLQSFVFEYHKSMGNITAITFLKMLLLLLLPGLFWLYFFAGNKGIFKSTRRALLPVFVMGIMVCIPAFAVEFFCVVLTRLTENPLTILISSFFIIGPLEEYLKSLAVDVGGYNKNERCGIPQLLAWYFAAAIGFASIENVLYYMAAGSKVFFFRIVLTTLAHVACSGIIAYFIGLFEDKPGLGFAIGFFFAMLVHGGYDYSINVWPITIWGWMCFFIAWVCFLETKLGQDTSSLPESSPQTQTARLFNA